MFPSAVRQFAARAYGRLFPGPFAAAGVALALFLGVSLVSRVGLALFSGEAAEFLTWRVAGWLAIGTVYDLAVGAFWLLPFALAAWLWPARRLRRGLQAVFVVFGLVACAALALTLASEFVFWNEFSSRFNFIAVDYLIYTREVIGNIRESYPMTPIVLGLAALAAVMVWLTLRPLWRAGAPTTMTFGRRSVWMAGYALLAVTSFLVVPPSRKEFSASAQSQQLAGNGVWEFFHALNTNEIDYGYFDNMEHFFGSSGYTFIDRSAIADKADIHYGNIWGVADEDLFTLTLRELDKRHGAGRPFFAHVMTTSNHRPFTYPAGRIDIPPGTSADGAVKYTDWALGDFIERARARPWFDDTVFVIVADHCAAARGKTDLPLDRFHIPMLIIAPKHIQPARVETIASQIDVPPTILALLEFGYVSRFFGQDILPEGKKHQRAMMANYQTVGYYEDGLLVELRPQRRVRVVDVATGKEAAPSDRTRHYTDEAIGHYQGASDAFRRGALRQPARLVRANAAPVIK